MHIKTMAQNLQEHDILVLETGPVELTWVHIGPQVVRYMTATPGRGVFHREDVVVIDCPDLADIEQPSPTFKLEIRTDSDAFKDITGLPHREVIQCLQRIINELVTDALDPCDKARNVKDSDGNIVGRWKLRDDA